jgi:hypothetical protein
MQCPSRRKEDADLLLSFCAQTLEPEKSDSLLRHIAECQDCRTFTEAQLAVWDLLDAWEPAPVSPDFDTKLFARIALEQAAPSLWQRIASPFSSLSWKPAFSVGTACIALFAVFLIRSPEASHFTPMVEKVDIEVVERSLDDMDMLTQIEPEPSAADSNSRKF